MQKALNKTKLDPCYFDIEITEGALMQNPSQATFILSKLKDMGIATSIDDFGTGYSSLSYLKSFPIDALKIDQSFVKDIIDNPDDASIASAITAMAHSLNLRVVAEGVETQEQVEFLKALHCDEMQGYFISKPLPAYEFEQFLYKTQQSHKKAA